MGLRDLEIILPQYFRRHNLNLSVLIATKSVPAVSRIAREENFVVMKIGIENSSVELIYIDVILSAPSLIGELYFKHHVYFHPLECQGWKTRAKKHIIMQIFYLFSWYQSLLLLRERGIRAHSWV